jgi:hypothetical protein
MAQSTDLTRRVMMSNPILAPSKQPSDTEVDEIMDAIEKAKPDVFAAVVAGRLTRERSQQRASISSMQRVNASRR